VRNLENVEFVDAGDLFDGLTDEISEYGGQVRMIFEPAAEQQQQQLVLPSQAGR
jgi:hypothetical protein